MKRKGPKPLYEQPKETTSFRLSLVCMQIIRKESKTKNISQAEVIERWARSNLVKEV